MEMHIEFNIAGFENTENFDLADLNLKILVGKLTIKFQSATSSLDLPFSSLKVLQIGTNKYQCGQGDLLKEHLHIANFLKNNKIAYVVV